MDSNAIRLGTRGSELALWQANHVKEILEKIQDRPVELVIISTKGDEILDMPLKEIGSKGLFTMELEQEMINGGIDAAIHSLKDLPTDMDEKFIISAFLERGSIKDALVFRKDSKATTLLEKLPDGCIIGTSSVRRQAQILKLNPNVKIKDIRGNINTRVQKLIDGEYDVICLAAAGLERLEFDKRDDIIVKKLSPRYFLPAVAQGCIAVQTLNKKDKKKLFQKLDHTETHDCVKMERELLQACGGGCSIPLGVFSEIVDNEYILKAILLSQDGKEYISLGDATRERHDAELIQNIITDLKVRGKGHLLT
ncbi:MAG: hydroxymethylbilane synthase [Candidatus Cloacimonadota bacterium]|nr:MAG: hydroxymethylbilane synthase [Candidatus Cloacimonadota bacterium]